MERNNNKIKSQKFVLLGNSLGIKVNNSHYNNVLIELSNQNENQIPKDYTNRQNLSDLI